MSIPCGFIDLQVNGYGGVDFNQDDLSPDDLHRSCERLAPDGVAAILATVITDQPEAMIRRLARIMKLRAQDPLASDVIKGFHIEGPFLSAQQGFRGAHPADAIQSATIEVMGRLTDACQGLLRLVTLAPEQDSSCAVIRFLKKQNVLIAGGHSDASLDQLRAAADAGLSLWTHLGNGCPMQLHRHDNIIQRILSLADRIRPTFIADGVHVPLFALRNYIHLAGVSRAIVVTDAMSAAGLGPGRHRLGRWEVEIGPDLAAWAPDRSHLVGSANTMRNSASNLQSIGFTPAQINDLCGQTAAKLLEIPMP